MHWCIIIVLICIVGTDLVLNIRVLYTDKSIDDTVLIEYDIVIIKNLWMLVQGHNWKMKWNCQSLYQLKSAIGPHNMANCEIPLEITIIALHIYTHRTFLVTNLEEKFKNFRSNIRQYSTPCSQFLLVHIILAL